MGLIIENNVLVKYIEDENTIEVIIPDGVTEIEKGAFGHCRNFRKVVIPPTVSNIRDYAFESCSSLEEVHISDLSAWCRISFGEWHANPLEEASLYIDGQSIEGNLEIPDDVNEISAYAFKGCTNLTSVTIHPGINKIGEGAFKYCRQLKEVHISDLRAWCQIDFQSTYAVDSNPLNSHASLFVNGESIEEGLRIPESIKSIKPGAFYCCQNLKTLIIPEGVTEIGENAFSSCKKLTNVKLPSSLLTIHNYAFRGCEELETVTFEKGIENIGRVAFDHCRKLKTELPESIKRIEPNSFQYVDELVMKDGDLPEWKSPLIFKNNDNLPFHESKIKIVGPDGEYALISVIDNKEETVAVLKEMAQNIRSVDGYFDFSSYDATFDVLKKVPYKSVLASYRWLYPYKLSEENKVKFEKWLKKQSEKVGRFWIDVKNSEIIAALFERGIFDDKVTTNLVAYAKQKDSLETVKALTESSSVTKSTSQTQIDSTKFKKWIKDYTDLRRPKAADKNSYVIEDDVLVEYKGGTKIAIIPDGVKKIGDKAFYGNRKVKEIIIPESVTEIGENAFEECQSLETLIIPDTVNVVRHREFYSVHSIFRSCYSLKMLVLPSIFCPEIGYGISFALKRNKMDDFMMLVLPDAVYSHYDTAYDKNVTAVCKRASALGFMLAKELYANNADFGQYYKYAIAQRKKLLPFIYKLDLVEALEFYDEQKKITAKTIDEYTENIPETALKCRQYLENWKAANNDAIKSSQKPLSKDEDEVLKLTNENTLKSIENGLSDFCGLKVKDLPEVTRKDGSKASKYLLATLLYKGIPSMNYVDRGDWGVSYWKNADGKEINSFVFSACDTAKIIMENLTEDSLQSSFIELSNNLLELSKYTKKFEVLRAVSLYANEETMKVVLQIGNKYSISMDYLINYWCYSSTKAAILHADKKKYIKAYANLRGLDEDEFREKYLSDCGLDETGCIEFDLGDRTVKACLQSNYTFALSDDSGKQLKSFPRSSNDKEKLNVAKGKYDEIKKTVEAIRKNLKKRRMEDYLTGKAIDTDEWLKMYMNEPVHKLFASTLVWSQCQKTFIVSGNSLIDADGNSYTLKKDEKIAVAHVMEMSLDDIEKWREYFLANKIRQPFEQIWELPIDFNLVEPSRYEGIELNHKILMGKSSHGIFYYIPSEWSGEGPELSFMNESLRMPELLYPEKEEHVRLGKIELLKKNRIANHVIYLLDKWTVFGRIAKDDISVMSHMDKYNASQIVEFLEIASENKAWNLNAALLEYKNNKFPDLDSFAELALSDSI